MAKTITEAELIGCTEKRLNLLIKRNGEPYFHQSETARAVVGTLHASKIFVKNENSWFLDSKLASDWEKTEIEKLKR